MSTSNKRLDTSSLFMLKDPLINRYPRLTTRGSLPSKADAVALFKGEQQLESPLRLYAYMGGSQPADVLWTGLIPLVAVSDRFIQILRDNGYTGWATYPVEIFGHKGEAIKGYHGLAITGRAAIDEGKANLIVEESPVPGGRPAMVRQYYFVEPSSWDGSDLFLAGTTTHICILQSVKKALEKARIRNVRFPRPEQIREHVKTL